MYRSLGNVIAYTACVCLCVYVCVCVCVCVCAHSSCMGMLKEYLPSPITSVTFTLLSLFLYTWRSAICGLICPEFTLLAHMTEKWCVLTTMLSMGALKENLTGVTTSPPISTGPIPPSCSSSPAAWWRSGEGDFATGGTDGSKSSSSPLTSD